MASSVGEKFARVAPEFFVPDVDASVAYYVAAFGFTLIRAEPHGTGAHVFAILVRGEVEFMFMDERFYVGADHALDDRRGSGADIRVLVDDVDAVYAKACEAGATIAHEIADRDYGLRDFIARDPDGYRVRWAMRIDG